MNNKVSALIITAALTWHCPSAFAEQPKSGVKSQAGTIIIGAQPLAYPVAMVTELMKRDLLLRKYLVAKNQALDERRFLTGDAMLENLKKDELQVAALGDMPTATAAARDDILIVALLKQEFSSVVARKFMQPKDLKGKRIAFAAGSTAHYTLLEGLASAGLGEKDVTLVEMKVSEMPDALENGLVDAFSAWEPAPTIALSRKSGNAAIYRGFNASYLVINRRFAAQKPDEVRQLLAACIRSINWLRQSGLKNAQKAAKWSIESGTAFSGKPSQLTVEQVIKITQQELLEMSSLPLIPKMQSTGYSPLSREFEFLKKIGKISPDSAWEKVNSSISRDLLNEVISNPIAYRLHEFDYAI